MTTALQTGRCLLLAASLWAAAARDSQDSPPVSGFSSNFGDASSLMQQQLGHRAQAAAPREDKPEPLGDHPDVVKRSFLDAPEHANAACPFPVKMQYGISCRCNRTGCGTYPDVTLLGPKQALIVTSAKGGLFMEPKVVATQSSSEHVKLNMAVETSKQHQEIFGFGGAVTDAVSYHYHNLVPEMQKVFVEQYWGFDGSRFSVARVPMNSADFSRMDYTMDSNDYPSCYTRPKCFGRPVMGEPGHNPDALNCKACAPHAGRPPAKAEASPLAGPAAGDGSWGEPWKSLADLASAGPDHRSLPPDFRLQLQLLECAVQQRRLLQQVLDHQSRATVRLEGLYTLGDQSRAVVQQHLEQTQQRFEEVLCCCQELAQRLPPPLEEVRSGARSGSKEGIDGVFARPVQLQPLETFQDNRHKDKSEDAGEVAKVNESRRSPSSVKTQVTHISTDTPMRRWLFNGTTFDLISASVIACNTITVGYAANRSIAWQVEHVGGDEVDMSETLRYIGYGFILFYTLELLLKIIFWRWDFFRNEQWRWNIFDCVLVVSGIYEVIMDWTHRMNDVNFAWMRMLRVMRMSKMLRVVRIMRFFRVLRMMVSAIARSMMTLAWSLLLLVSLNFIFGLVFIQILSSFLSESTANEVSEDTLASIKTHWGSVWQAIVTLYYAVTGGSDWEKLARPIREAGEVYHMIFLFYVAFTVFSVVNIMTGLYVEGAENVSKEDHLSVGRELAKRKETRRFVQYFERVQEAPEDGDPGDYISISALEEHFESEVVQTFARTAELSLDDFRTVFSMLDTTKTGRVLMSDFLDGCLHTNAASVSLDMLVLTCETLKCSRQQASIMELLQKCHDELSELSKQGGVKRS